MDGHIVGRQKEQRHELTLEDVREISRQYDGDFTARLDRGEPTVWKDLFQVIEAVDPCKDLVVLDSNAYLLDEELTNRLADAGYKMQISLDSFVEAEHDTFRKVRFLQEGDAGYWSNQEDGYEADAFYLSCPRSGIHPGIWGFV